MFCFLYIGSIGLYRNSGTIYIERNKRFKEGVFYDNNVLFINDNTRNNCNTKLDA